MNVDDVSLVGEIALRTHPPQPVQWVQEDDD